VLVPFVRCDGWLKANNPFKKGGANIEEKKRDEMCNRVFKTEKEGQNEK
jgi:hypothetical protein